MIVVTFGLLALCVASAWSTHWFRIGAHCLRWWTPLFLAALAMAWWSGFLQGPGILALTLLAWLARADRNDHESRVVRFTFATLMMLLAAALAAHQVPGFSNPILLQDHRFSADAVPYTQHANFDKGAAGLILLLYCCTLAQDSAQWRQLLRQVTPIALGTCAAVIGCALWLGYARFDFKLPAYTPIFLTLNLFFTCVAEEAFFRGVLQHRLAQALTQRGCRHGGIIAVIVIAGVFGVAHTGGGWGYVALATLAGLGYGFAYFRTGRIEASILVHFAVNASHFIGFTYPRLA